MKGTTVLAASEFHSWSIGYFKGFSSQNKSDCSRKDTFILKVEQKKNPTKNTSYSSIVPPEG